MGFHADSLQHGTPGGPVRCIGSLGLWCLLAPFLVPATVVISVTPPPKFSLTCVHIPGKSNELADDLSRDKFHSFYSEVPGVSANPTLVSQTLIEVLLDPRIDWLSQTWMQLFTSTVNRD